MLGRDGKIVPQFAWLLFIRSGTGSVWQDGSQQAARMLSSGCWHRLSACH
jgi:hypothetical protein